MNLNELKEKAYQCAVAHGWYDEEHNDKHWLCLVISELMEAVQADREGKRADIHSFVCVRKMYNGFPEICFIEDFDKYMNETV